MEFNNLKLEDLATFKYGKMPNSKKKSIGGPYPIYTGYKISGYYPEYMYEDEMLIIVARGVGGTGDVKIAPPKCYITNLAIILELDKANCDYKYMQLYLQSLNLRYLDSGSAQSQITINDLKRLKVSIPDLTSQQKIAKRISNIEEKITNNNNIIHTLEQLSQTIFKHWFIDFEFPNEEGKPYKSSGGEFKEIKDEEIPINWKIGVLDDIVEVIYGAAFSSKFFNEVGNGLPLIRIRDLKNGKPQFFTNEIHKKATVINPGDLLIGMDAEFKPTLWKGTKAYLNQRICLVRPKKNIINKLFLKFLLEPQMRFLESAKVGTTVIHLSKKDIDSINIVIPTESILKKFSILIDPILEEIIIKQKEIQSLTQLRDTLLPKLLSGEIEIPDNLEV
ncbi:restriction endonuclease subunit S [Aerococcus urinaeequi]|uniref:restriction endonuclease subunit S n=1 Tax=Aerococcus urinaeequi TaxID=51665 RepID=UPI003B3B39F2